MMGWDETSLTPPDPLVPRPHSRLTAYNGKCIECNELLGLDEVAITTYEVQSKPEVLRIGQTGYVSATYSDTEKKAWIHLTCLFKLLNKTYPKE
jgi:hypothetical protein